jgi:hypothetical protein
MILVEAEEPQHDDDDHDCADDVEDRVHQLPPFTWAKALIAPLRMYMAHRVPRGYAIMDSTAQL